MRRLLSRYWLILNIDVFFNTLFFPYFFLMNVVQLSCTIIENRSKICGLVNLLILTSFLYFDRITTNYLVKNLEGWYVYSLPFQIWEQNGLHSDLCTGNYGTSTKTPGGGVAILVDGVSMLLLLTLLLLLEWWLILPGPLIPAMEFWE